MTSRAPRTVLLTLLAALAVTTSVIVAAPSSDAGVQDSQRYKAHAKRSYQVWEAVAACESSHEWHINTHNGYFGGIQFLQATWIGFGGRKYAKRADLATRAQQIAVARRVLAAQGPKAWPVCGKRAHLTRGRGLATSTPLPDIRGFARPAPVHHRKHPKPVHHRKHPKPKHHTYRHYRVRNGDSLSTIADRFHVRLGQLWNLNQRVVPHGNLVVVGQVLRIPPKTY